MATTDWFKQRRDGIVERLARDGYQMARTGEDEVVMHRRRLSLTRFGFLDSVVVIDFHRGVVTKSDLVDHEEGAVREALLLKIALPRGLFSAVEVFPITLADGAEDDAVDYVCNALRNRWAVLAMPAVVHDGGDEVAAFSGNKVWGGAYIGGLRSKLSGWLAAEG